MKPPRPFGLYWKLSLTDFGQLGDTADFHPFHNIDVSGVIETCAVGADEFAGREMIAGQLARFHIRTIGVITKLSNDFVGAIKNCHAGEEIRYNNVAVLIDVEVAGRGKVVHEIHVLAIKGEALQAFVGAVGHCENWFAAAGIDDDAVRTIELAGLFSFATEGPNILAFAVVLVDVARAVTVTDIDVTIRCDGQVGRAVLNFLAGVRFGFLRILERQDFFAVKRGLDHEAALSVAQIEELLLVFFVDVEAVRATFEFFAPALDKLAFVIEDDHAVGLFAGSIYGVVDVNVAVGIFANAVGVAVGNADGKFAPIVCDLVFVVAFTYDRLEGAGFVVSS